MMPMKRDHNITLRGIYGKFEWENRDTAWYAAIDSEWPQLEEAFVTWLAPDNFDDQGTQRLRLSDLIWPILNKVG